MIWDLAAPTLWRLQQRLGEVKWVAVRDGACIHSRLLGFCVHETIHALCGDPTLPNYGTPVGLAVWRARVGARDRGSRVSPSVQPARGARVGRARARSRIGCSGSSGHCCRRAMSARTASPVATRSSTSRRVIAACRTTITRSTRGATSRSRTSSRTRRARGSRRRSSTRSPREFEAAEAIGRAQRPSVSVSRGGRADQAQEARAQRPLLVRLDAQVEAVLRPRDQRSVRWLGEVRAWHGCPA